MTILKVLILCFVSLSRLNPLIALNLNLLESHVINHYANFPEFLKECLENDSCDHKDLMINTEITKNTCWGYEKHCNNKNNFKHFCPKSYDNFEEDQLDTFYNQADFGK